MEVIKSQVHCKDLNLKRIYCSEMLPPLEGRDVHWAFLPGHPVESEAGDTTGLCCLPALALSSLLPMSGLFCLPGKHAESRGWNGVEQGISDRENKQRGKRRRVPERLRVPCGMYAWQGGGTFEVPHRPCILITFDLKR